MATEQKSTAAFGLGPQDTPAKPSDVKKPGEATVTMVFPRRVILNTNEHRRIEFLPGVQEVPQHLLDVKAHVDWLKRNGAEEYSSARAKTEIENAKSVEEAQKDFDAAQAKLNAAKKKAAIDSAKFDKDRVKPLKEPKPPYSAKPPQKEPKAPKPAKVDPPAKPVEVDLTKMSRADIAAHAAEVHGLDLDPTGKRDDLISAVKEAQAKTAGQ